MFKKASGVGQFLPFSHAKGQEFIPIRAGQTRVRIRVLRGRGRSERCVSRI